MRFPWVRPYLRGAICLALATVLGCGDRQPRLSVETRTLLLGAQATAASIRVLCVSTVSVYLEEEEVSGPSSEIDRALSQLQAQLGRQVGQLRSTEGRLSEQDQALVGDFLAAWIDLTVALEEEIDLYRRSCAHPQRAL